MDLNKAIEYAQLVNAAYAIQPGNLVSSSGMVITAGGTTYTVVATIYANDLATDMNPDRGDDVVSIGLICQAVGAGDVVIAIRGTEGIQEWVHDAEFLQVPCPFLAAAGNTEDGFTAMYNSLRTGDPAGSPSVVDALATLPFTQPVTSMTICGHSMGGALATLLALDMTATRSSSSSGWSGALHPYCGWYLSPALLPGQASPTPSCRGSNDEQWIVSWIRNRSAARPLRADRTHKWPSRRTPVWILASAPPRLLAGRGPGRVRDPGDRPGRPVPARRDATAAGSPA